MRNWLLDKRKELGKTQEQVAEESGIKRPYYSMIENGDRNPSVNVAKRISQSLEFEWTIFFKDKVTK